MIRLQIQGETPAKKNANTFNAKTKAVYKKAGYRKWYDGARLQIDVQCRIEKHIEH